MAWSNSNALKYGLVGGFFGKKKKSSPPAYEFQPYTGPRPEAPNYLRPTEAQLYKILTDRSQGIDVGYDPARKASALALLTSENQKRREDDVRDARGRVAASGLSGNLRAQEALTGRVERDSARELTDSINALNVDDLTYAADERDRNTDRLQGFNNFNFGQSNKVADFGLDVYGTEQGFKRGASQDAMAGYQYDRGQSDEFTNSLLQGAGTVAGMYFGGPAGAAAGGSAAAALAGSGGKGIAPTPGVYDNATNLKRGKAYRALTY